MKTYSEFMNELSGQEIYRALLGFGMFSEKLPPCFKSEKFYDFCINNNTTPFQDKAYQYVYYENMRNINIPRQLGIPVPMAYQKLCKIIADNWDKIQKHFEDNTKNQKYKNSRIHIRKMYGKEEIFEMNYSNWKTDGTLEPELCVGMKYVVSADISNCFPSIYTHSVTWALAGKTTAKANRHGNWYNDIDHCLQNTKDLETHGILIGPHASNIIAEIVLCVVDNNLVSKGWKYLRHIDDFTCYVENEDRANEFLVDLQKELRFFGLSLNHKKTNIEKLPLATVEQWIRKINSISILTHYGKVDYKNCRAYLDFAIEIAKDEKNNSSVLKYAIKVLSGLDLTENAKKYEQQLVFQLALLYPYLVPLLEEYIFIKCNTQVSDIENISNLIYKEYIQKLRYEAVGYAIYFALKYSFCLNDITIDKIVQTDDCVLLTLAYKYFEKNGNIKAVKALKSYARSIKNDEKKFEKMWLFMYEILPLSDLQNDWKVLKKNKITFIEL